MDLDKFGNNPSGIALKFLYSGLDLKCNYLEVEFRRAFEELLYFVNIYLSETGQGNYNEDVKLIFNRDIQINKTEAINNCVASQDVISEETIISNHPWVDDVEAELKKRKEKADRASNAFGDYNIQKVDDNEE